MMYCIKSNERVVFLKCQDELMNFNLDESSFGNLLNRILQSLNDRKNISDSMLSEYSAFSRVDISTCQLLDAIDGVFCQFLAQQEIIYTNKEFN